MLTRVTWPLVALVTVVLGSVVALTFAHADAHIITDVMIGVGLGGVGGMVNGVRNNVNGNITKLIALLESAIAKLAASNPPPQENTGGV